MIGVYGEWPEDDPLERQLALSVPRQDDEWGLSWMGDDVSDEGYIDEGVEDGWAENPTPAG